MVNNEINASFGLNVYGVW